MPPSPSGRTSPQRTASSKTASTRPTTAAFGSPTWSAPRSRIGSTDSLRGSQGRVIAVDDVPVGIDELGRVGDGFPRRELDLGPCEVMGEQAVDDSPRAVVVLLAVDEAVVARPGRGLADQS